MNITFDENICGNFNIAANKEWLETNELGGYSASTIYGLNNRRYHGLFVIPVGTSAEKTIILSKFEESVFVGKQVYELSTNQFSGGIYPDGFQHLISFSLDPFPRFLYQIDGRRLEKTIFMLHDQHTLVVRYEYKNQGPPFNLVLKPMIAGREISDLSHEVSTINTDSYLESGVVKLAPKDTIPELKIYYQSGEYLPAPLWYHSYIYEKDFRRKQRPDQSMIEDLYNPGFFTCTLEPYETFDMFISVDKLNQMDYESLYRREKLFRRTFDPAVEKMPMVAKEISKRVESLAQVKSDSIPVHVSGYPIDKMETREMLFSLWGLAILDKNKIQIQKSIQDYLTHLNRGLLPDSIGHLTEKATYKSADLSLIFINLLYYLYHSRINQEFLAKNLFEPCVEIIEAYLKGITPHIRQDEDGLIYSGSNSISSSWSSQISGKGTVTRYGKLCEINALWYNSIKIMEFFSREIAKKKLVKKYASMAEMVKASFLKKFWSTKHLRYYDFIREDRSDPTFSINQLYLVSLPFSILDVERGVYVLNQIEEHLLTPLGLRTLSPNEKKYIGRFDSLKTSSGNSNHLGSIWPLTIGMYIDAVIRYRGNNQQVINNLNQTLETLGKFFYEQGLGNISEFFEGDPPHRRGGQLCHGVNLSELLRAHHLIYKADEEKYIEAFQK